MDFEIFFNDLNEDAQKRLMEAVGIDDPSEMNWDINMCPLAMYPLPEKEMNTRMEYLYRDRSNYKTTNEFIISGWVTERQKKEIADCLEDGQYFIPEQIGLPLTRGWDINDDDHPYCELDPECDFFETAQPPADPEFTAEKLVALFREAKGKWDPAKYAPEMEDY